MEYLYIKTHIKTGLKYLGKTKNDPFIYKGSGIIWKSHCKKHGWHVNTQILLATDDKKELRETGIFFSNLFNIVESKDWANLTVEQGQGGIIPGYSNKGRKRSKEEIEKWKKSCIRNGTLGNNNVVKAVETRRITEGYASNRDPEVIEKHRETKRKNKELNIPGYGKQSEEARKRRTGIKRGPYKKNHTCGKCGHISTKSGITRHTC